MRTTLRFLFAMLFAFVGMTAWAQVDYEVTDWGNSTHTERYTSAVNLTMYSGKQTISGIQTAKQQAIYWNRTSEMFTCPAGAEITPSVTFTGSWMNAYVYIDENKDGFSASNEDIDTNHVLKKSSDIDLRSYSRYNIAGNSGDYNSNGELLTSFTDEPGNVREMPSFTAPLKSGTYRVRYKVDWNSIDPNGNNQYDTSVSPAVDNRISTNGGIIVDVTLNVAETYTINYVDNNGNPISAIANVTSGYSAYNADSANVISVGSVINFFSGNNFLVRDFVSATLNGNTYNSWAEVASEIQANDVVEVTLAEPFIQDGKYYTIKNRNNSRYANDNKNGPDNGNNLRSEVIDDNNIAVQHIFKIENAGNGKFYIKNAATNRYVKRPGKVGTETKLITTLTRDDECTYWITNAFDSEHPEFYAFSDATLLSNPILQKTEEYSWHTNVNNSNEETNQYKVVRWNASAEPSQWYMTNVPVVTIVFKNPNGEPIVDSNGNPFNPTFTADGSATALAAENKVLATTVQNIAVNDYAVVGRQLKVASSEFYESYDTSAAFYDVVNNLTEDADAILYLRPRTNDEVDITLDIYNENGEYYNDIECSGEPGTATRTDYKAWRYTNSGSETDINGKAVPSDLVFMVYADEGTTGSKVGNIIYNLDKAQYRYKKESGGDNCLTFQSKPLGDGNDTNIPPYKYKMSVNSTGSETYYILQYELGVIPNSVDYPQLFENEGGSSVLTGDPANDAKTYTITDTPAKNETWFRTRVTDYTKSDATDAEREAAKTSAQPSAANFFQVRIVNKTYLINSMDYGRSICWNALQGKVGYPIDGTERTNLSSAIYTFDESSDDGDKFDNYIAMLQAYSKYISCTDLNMPEDCQVYTLSFIKPDGSKVLLNNNGSDLEVVEYTEANRSAVSARWISHKDTETGKMMFISKRDGKYLQAKYDNADADGLSAYYNDNTTAFYVSGLNQDISDYMSSSTDEKLLGAVYMKTAGRASGETGSECVLTINGGASNNDFASTIVPQYNVSNTSAMLIELIGEGNTYNNVTFRRIGDDGPAYASYYGFYPVANPNDITMYYVTGVEGNYMKLQEVQSDVVRPGFGVILKSDTPGETHLHVGKYTEQKETDINALLAENGENKLTGTYDDIVRAEAYSDKKIYVLSGNTKYGVGFYLYEGVNMPKGKAYYVSADPMPAIRGFLFDVNGVTTTVELNPAEQKDAVIYDLSGRRMNSAKSGLYIINGKKVIM